MDEDLVQRGLAELVGTLVVVFAGVGAFAAASAAMPELVAAAVGFGLAYAIAIALVAPASGGHVNPATTLAAWLTRRLSVREALTYVVAQFAGAGLAAGLLDALLVPSIGTGGIELAVSSTATVLGALSVEIVATFLLVGAWFALVDEGKPVAWLGVGLAAMAAVLVAFPVTSAALNPAQAWAWVLVDGHLIPPWLHVLGPALGGSLAGAFHEAVLARSPD
jgi:aquaporin Z